MIRYYLGKWLRIIGLGDDWMAYGKALDSLGHYQGFTRNPRESDWQFSRRLIASIREYAERHLQDTPENRKALGEFFRKGSSYES